MIELVYLVVLKSDQGMSIKMAGPRRAPGYLEGLRGKYISRACQYPNEDSLLLVKGPHLTNANLFLFLACHIRASSVML